MATLIAVEKNLSTAGPNESDPTQTDFIYTVIFAGSDIPAEDANNGRFETDILVARPASMNDAQFEAARAQAYRDFASARWSKTIAINEVSIKRYVKA